MCRGSRAAHLRHVDMQRSGRHDPNDSAPRSLLFLLRPATEEGGPRYRLHIVPQPARHGRPQMPASQRIEMVGGEATRMGPCTRLACTLNYRTVRP